MLTPALLNYIQQNLSAGKSKDRIKSELMLAGGWQESEIETAFATLQTGPYKTSAGSKIGSFFLTVVIVLVILGGLAFAAEKYFGPVITNIGNNIVAALPWNHSTAPSPNTDSGTLTQIPAPAVPSQSPATPDTLAPSAVQTPVTPVAILTAPATPPPLITCKTNDMDCLLQAATTCNPATVTNTVKGSETSTRLYAIIGVQNNMCSMTFSVKSDTVKANQSKGGLCNLSVADLTAVLTDWKAGDYSATDVDLASQCTGSYFN